jgi:hypothetical protein
MIRLLAHPLTPSSVSKLSLFLTSSYAHCNENPIYVSLEKELRGLSPNFHLHVSVSDLYIFKNRSTYFPAAE